MAIIEYDVSDGVCVLRLNAPPVNAITFAMLEELRSAIRRANADPDVGGIVLTGGADHFSAGADVGLFRQIASRQEAIETSRIFQEAFQDVEDSAKCVAAAVAGKLMGSAVELAMACHYRVGAEGSRFSMPEVLLGINPGAGGTQRLPRLIGLAPALQMLLGGQAIHAARALELGLVEALCPPEQLVERAAALVGSGDEPRRTGRRAEKLQDPEANEAAFRRAREMLSGVREEIVAPRKIVEAVGTGLTESLQAGLRAEREAFADCMDTPAARNKIYLFFATRGTSKADGLADAKPAKIARAAVVGMGSMGTGIAHALIIAGVPVRVYDEQASAVEKGMARIRRSVEKRVGEGKMTPGRAEGMLGLLSPASGWSDLADADLVIEAVYEDAAVKRSVLAAIEGVCREGAILATNTSTISLDVLAEALRHGERLIGMHFFNPAHRMPLVEIIRREATDAGVIATALKFARDLRKTPVLVRNREGFLVNRIFVPYFKEAFWLLEEGAAARDVDEAMVEFGFPMGPLTLIDMAGIDILADVDKVMRRAFPAHGGLSGVAEGLVARGLLGQKTGAGVYRYEKGDYARHDSETTDEILADVRRRRGLAPRPVHGEEITRRLVLRMVNEAFYVIQEGIAQRESDVDAAMVLGTGFPDFRGGVMKYARDLGLAKVVALLDALAADVGERFAPCRLLRDQSETKEP